MSFTPRIHDPSARKPECPFQAAAGVAPGPGGKQSITFVRQPCGDWCALFDARTGRTCLDRVVEALANRVSHVSAEVPTQ